MFRYSSFLDTLLKAMTHKYIRRVPKGVTKTGKTKYMYFYVGQEGHGKGIAHENELVEGASFAFGELGKTRYHAHISKVDGDKVTVKYDDGAKKGQEETMTKKQFQTLVHGEHATGIKEAQAKADKQLKDFQVGKEKGVKVKQSTLDRLAQRVANLKDLVGHIDQPAPIDAPWMSERERRLFDGQNKLFDMLKRRQITTALLKDRTNNDLIWDMLQNITTAIFKYKDISEIPKSSLITLITASRIAYNDDGNPTTPEHISTVITALSDLWQKLPYAPQEKNEKIGRLDVIHADLVKQTTAQKNKREIHIEAIKQAQEAMIKTDPELAKIIYGNIIFTQITEKSGIDKQAQGFFASGTPSHEVHNLTTTLDTVHHSADVIYLNTEDHFDQYPIIPKKVKKQLQVNYHKAVAIHEIAHRFSKSLLEQKSNAFDNDIRQFFVTYANKKRAPESLLNRPIKEFTFFDSDSTKLLNAMLRSPDARLFTNEFEANIIRNNQSRGTSKVAISKINFDALGDSMIISTDNVKGTSELQVPLLNGDFMRISIQGTIQDIQESFNEKRSLLPTTYAQTNMEECFSEMMGAVCDPNYKDEPMRTEFLALLKRHIGGFGA